MRVCAGGEGEGGGGEEGEGEEGVGDMHLDECIWGGGGSI